MSEKMPTNETPDDNYQSDFEKFSDSKKEEIIEASRIEAVSSEFRNQLERGNIENAKMLSKEHNLPVYESQPVINDEIETSLKRGNVDYASKLREEFGVSEDDFNRLLTKSIENTLKYGNPDISILLKEKFDLDDYNIKFFAVDGIKSAIKSGYNEDVMKIKDAFNISDEDANQALYEVMRENLVGITSNVNNIEKILQSDVVPNKEEYIELAISGITQNLRDYYKDNALDTEVKGDNWLIKESEQIKDLFNISDDDFELIKKGIIEGGAQAEQEKFFQERWGHIQ